MFFHSIPGLFDPTCQATLNVYRQHQIPGQDLNCKPCMEVVGGFCVSTHLCPRKEDGAVTVFSDVPYNVYKWTLENLYSSSASAASSSASFLSSIPREFSLDWCICTQTVEGTAGFWPRWQLPPDSPTFPGHTVIHLGSGKTLDIGVEFYCGESTTGVATVGNCPRLTIMATYTDSVRGQIGAFKQVGYDPDSGIDPGTNYSGRLAWSDSKYNLGIFWDGAFGYTLYDILADTGFASWRT